MASSLGWLGVSTSTSPIFPFRTERPVSELLARMLFLTPTRSLTRCLTRDFADRRFSLTASFLGRMAAHREASRLRAQPWSVMARSAATSVAEPAQGGASPADQPGSEALLESFLTKQQRVARMEPADEARTLIALGGCGAACTIPHLQPACMWSRHHVDRRLLTSRPCRTCARIRDAVRHKVSIAALQLLSTSTSTRRADAVTFYWCANHVEMAPPNDVTDLCQSLGSCYLC